MKPNNSVDGFSTPNTIGTEVNKSAEPTNTNPEPKPSNPNPATLESDSAVTVNDEPTTTTPNTQTTPAPTTNMPEKKEDSSKTVWIMMVVFALLIGGGIGYIFGADMSQSDSQQELEQQIKTLENDLEAAKASVSGDIEEGQDAIDESAQTIEDLEAQNAELQTTIDEQAQQIADLEEQLKAAETP